MPWYPTQMLRMVAETAAARVRPHVFFLSHTAWPCGSGSGLWDSNACNDGLFAVVYPVEDWNFR